MPTFIHEGTTSGTALTGTYNYDGGTFIVPSGATAPVAGQGSLLYLIPGSGVLLVSSGSAWAAISLTT